LSKPDRSYAHIAKAVFDTPWFIREAEGTVIGSIVRGRIAGERLAEAEIAERIQAARAQQGPRNSAPAAGPVAIIPVYGIIMPRANLMTEMSGGTTVEFIKGAMAEALSDKSIAAVIADFDSPGGSVEGIEELATWIRENRGTKPMVAVVDTMACSAAYYLAAQFDEIVASPSSLTGSIGVFTEHIEFSKADALEGVTTTIVQQPATKHDINDSQPLTDAAEAHLQQMVDDYYAQFVGAVAKGRGVSVTDIRDGYGQGRELTSARAKAAGLVDRVDTLDNTNRRLASGRGRAEMALAADSPLSRVAAWGDSLSDTPAALDSEPFAARLSLVSAGARALVEHARERADMRAKEGRSLSASDRSGLLAVADALREVADLGTPEADASEPISDWRPKGRVALQIALAELDLDIQGVPA
jgi:signal peptide peptidase SppA